MFRTSRMSTLRRLNFILFLTVIHLCVIGRGMSLATSLIGADGAISQIDMTLGGEKKKQGSTGESKADILMHDIWEGHPSLKMPALSFPAHDRNHLSLTTGDEYSNERSLS